ncbi:hypothetical protein ASG06_03995 [Rathayibacter sp. Leaf185]|nr:hypothetical protein ASF42_03985 [Rathayibacter sp. Leaf294]KQS13591.1 hypothetical protein ASG06_03995 [Rathayibacter sp. Leaf185]
MIEGLGAEWIEPLAEEATADAKYAETIKTVTSARDALLGALLPREIRPQSLSLSNRSGMSIHDWLHDVHGLTGQALSTRIPFFNVSKLEDRKLFTDKAERVLSHFADLRHRIATDYQNDLNGIAQRAFDGWLQRVATAWSPVADEIQRDNAPYVSMRPRDHHASWNGRVPSSSTVPIPVVQPGRVQLQEFRFDGYTRGKGEGGASVSRRISLRADRLNLEFPVAVDFDTTGGFVTESPALIESAVIQLLATLPAGMLRVDAVDPVGLGESLKFLYGLNDAGDKVLGDAVWTTAEQSSKLLIELEKHVTFVTQKYLQGQHSSLTEYNVAAGEVAEPYRAVLLYDFPAMFTRDGNSWDGESLNRLEKLVGAGRRAGVFFLVRSSGEQPTLESLLDLNSTSVFGAPETAPTSGHFTDLHLGWEFVGNGAPSAADRELVFSSVLRGLSETGTTQVDPARVADLAAKHELQAQRRGVAFSTDLAQPDRPSTWWRGSSEDALVARIGRMGASGIAQIHFNSQMESSALIGGRTGSGKSYLLHAIIMDLVLQYGPDELELYLIDLKEGVEFKQYADHRLPHAKAVAVESNREFAISILRALDTEIARRGELFNATGAATSNLTQMRRLGGTKLPRILLVIDEFHKLFERDDALRAEAERLLERIIKEGRAFGVHSILGSQSIATVGSGFRSLAGQIFYRLVLASSEEDSRILLGEGNPDAQLLTKQGEGILNAKAGLREANNRFQTAFWAPEYRAERLTEVREKADALGLTQAPIVFDGRGAYSVDQVQRDHLGRSSKSDALLIPVGAPMSLEPVVWAVLDRAPGRNLLIVDELGLHQLLISAADLRLALVDTTLVDFGVFDANGEAARDQLELAGVRVVRYRALITVLDELLTEIDGRKASQNYTAEPRVLMLAGLHRARDFSSDSYSNEPGSASAKLERLLVEGPEFGVFTIAWADRPASIARRLTSDSLREFTVKLVGVMSADDSRRLTDSDRASSLKRGETLLDDFDRATTTVLRRLEFPGADWLASQIVQQRDTVG